MKKFILCLFLSGCGATPMGGVYTSVEACDMQRAAQETAGCTPIPQCILASGFCDAEAVETCTAAITAANCYACDFTKDCWR